MQDIVVEMNACLSIFCTLSAIRFVFT